MAFAEEAAHAEAAAHAEGPPLAYAAHWGLVLVLFAITALLLFLLRNMGTRQARSAATKKLVFALSVVQVALVFAALATALLAADYHEPLLPGYLRHLALLVTGGLVSSSALMVRPKR